MQKSQDAKSIILAIYSKFNPDKIADIDNLLKKYSGSEDELIKGIFTKYNISQEDRKLFLSMNETMSILDNKNSLILPEKGDQGYTSKDINVDNVKNGNRVKDNRFLIIILANIILLIIVVSVIISFNLNK